MPTIVGILIFMSRINSCSVVLSMKKNITQGQIAGWVIINVHFVVIKKANIISNGIQDKVLGG